MKRRNRDADNLSFRLDKAADVIPIIWEHLDEQRALIHPLGNDGDGKCQPGTHSDPVGRVIDQLASIDLLWTEIEDWLASIKLGIDRLEEACAKALGTRGKRAGEDEPKCAGGDPSTWGDPTCDNLVGWKVGENNHVSHDQDGLCPIHRRQRDEWERMTEDERRRAEESNARRRRRHRPPSGPIRSGEPKRGAA